MEEKKKEEEQDQQLTCKYTEKKVLQVSKTPTGL